MSRSDTPSAIDPEVAGGLFADLRDKSSTREILPSDELLHPAPAGDRSWTETVWFATLMPEHHMVCWLYMLFRRNVGTVDAGFWVFDDTSFNPWEMPYARPRWNLALPETDLYEATIGENIHYKVIEPFKRHEITYRDSNLVEMDLTLDALFPPRAVGLKDTTGHIDQAIWATGSVTVDGRKLTIDGPAMRDRSWGPRPDSVGRKAHYSFGVSPDTMFQALVVYEPDGSQSVQSGSVFVDGVWSNLVSVNRRVLARRDGPPLRVEMILEDAEGRSITATGVTTSSAALWTQPSLFSWISMVRWTINGREVWGEDDEGWTPEVLAYRRRHPGPSDIYNIARSV